MNNGVSTNKKTLINVFCSLVLLCTNLVISFFLSPYIVKNIGVEANGFIQLANNFVTYAQLIVTALNGMAARYITLEYTKQNYEKANLFYNSVFWGNIFIVLYINDKYMFKRKLRSSFLVTDSTVKLVWAS